MTTKPIYSYFFLFLLLAATSLQSGAETLTGRVVGVTDGDTLTLLQNRQQTRIRLAEIDTPEKKQPYGQKAKQALSDLVFGQTVDVIVVDTDRYGRTIGKVLVDGLDVNRQLVRDGMAWVYRRYNRDPTLLQVEADARAARRGLWSLSTTDRVPPWEWRKTERQARVGR